MYSVPVFRGVVEKVCWARQKRLAPPRLELGTFCVLDRRDNHYTTEPWRTARSEHMVHACHRHHVRNRTAIVASALPHSHAFVSSQSVHALMESMTLESDCTFKTTASCHEQQGRLSTCTRQFSQVRLDYGERWTVANYPVRHRNSWHTSTLLCSRSEPDVRTMGWLRYVWIGSGRCIAQAREQETTGNCWPTMTCAAHPYFAPICLLYGTPIGGMIGEAVLMCAYEGENVAYDWSRQIAIFLLGTGPVYCKFARVSGLEGAIASRPPFCMYRLRVKRDDLNIAIPVNALSYPIRFRSPYGWSHSRHRSRVDPHLPHQSVMPCARTWPDGTLRSSRSFEITPLSGAEASEWLDCLVRALAILTDVVSSAMYHGIMGSSEFPPLSSMLG